MRPGLGKFAIALAVAGAAAAGGFAWYQARPTARSLPDTVTVANGRIEVERVDVATKLPGRIAVVDVREGDRVEAGQVLARVDETEMRAQLAAAKAFVQRAQQGIAKAEAETASREADLVLAEVELKRAADLRDRAVTSQADADRRLAQRNVAAAAVQAAKAAVGDARAALAVAEAQAAQVEATLADMVLKAPVAGRVEYRMVQPGEVVGAGARVLTLLDLGDVYMTVFLPTRSIGRVRLGAEARIVLDAAPDYVVPARISFVAAEAQFTPKSVETADEREKLMYRVKVQVPTDVLGRYRDYVKAGLTGNAYVRLGEDAPWPDWLAPRLPDVSR
ncbi:HlyD family secretion protein [Prosthecomicrobium sp. N25]|uniref:HlyD family secretion protein n=1 Tax=Prosthecomicrobium sp. N25 TaxID=3129254 RepID=UPI003076F176